MQQCRLCLNEPDENSLYALDFEMTILELADGGKVTVGDALKYINLEILVPMIEPVKTSFGTDDEEDNEYEIQQIKEIKDHPEIPKSLCQDCLDKLQSMYEFKFRCEENREYLKNHVKELAEEREAAEKAARQAIVAELEFDISNIDALPDKLVLKSDISTKRRPRRKKDPEELAAAQIARKKKANEKNIIIAEESQLDTAIYVRKVITTPEKASTDQQHSSKRKSKHIVMVDIPVAEKPKTVKYDRTVRKKEPLCDLNESNNSEAESIITTQSVSITEDTNSTSKAEKFEDSSSKLMRDEEPIFEDDMDEMPVTKRPKRTRK